MGYANEQAGQEDFHPTASEDFSGPGGHPFDGSAEDHKSKDEIFDLIKRMEFTREAEIFKALGHPIRLKIVYGLLKVGGCNVKNMQECLGLHQATVSQHLIHLKTRGIIQSSRQGLEMVYTVTDNWAKCIVDNIEKNKVLASYSSID
jgi:ArsR family transcriptional regulator